jgi:hypothetical protein
MSEQKKRLKGRFLLLAVASLLVICLATVSIFGATHYQGNARINRDKKEAEQSYARVKLPGDLRLQDQSYKLVRPARGTFDNSLGYTGIDPTYVYVYDVSKPHNSRELTTSLLNAFQAAGFSPDYDKQTNIYNMTDLIVNVPNGPVAWVDFNGNTFDADVSKQPRLGSAYPVQKVTITVKKYGMAGD